MVMMLMSEPPAARLKRIGEVLRAARRARGLTVIEVAVRAGVAQKVVERIESGLNTTIMGLLDVAQVLGVAVDAQGEVIEAEKI